MITYQGELSDPSSRSNFPMLTESEASMAYELASVTSEAWDNQIDVNIAKCNFLSDSFNSDIPPDSADADLAEALATRAEVSKLSASIGSCSVDDKPCSLFDKLSKPT